MTTLVIGACHESSAPPPVGPSVRIVPVADSVFEGDVVRLTAQLLDGTGAEVPAAPVTWAVSDETLARVEGEGNFTLLKPGTVRITATSGEAAGTYDLVIGKLAVKRVELMPGALSLGRGDRVQVTAHVLGQGDRTIEGRTVTFASDNELVAVIGSPDNVIGAPGFLIAAGPGSTVIRASVDGVTGTAPVDVVTLDTTFALTHYNGAPLPVLVDADTVTFNGVKEFAEVYAESGTLVLSGLLQKRYQVDVRFTQYAVTRTETTVTRVPRFTTREFDHGLVTDRTNGNLTMLSEFIGPHLEHTATVQPDGFLVHFRVPGDDIFLDLRYQRVPQ